MTAVMDLSSSGSSYDYCYSYSSSSDITVDEDVTIVAAEDGVTIAADDGVEHVVTVGVNTPDTFPLENSPSSQEEQCSKLNSTNAWAILFPIDCRLYKTFHFDTDDFSLFGRDSCCHYRFLCEDGFDKSEETKLLFSQISKQHFKVYKEQHETLPGEYLVKLEDLSSNGTYVNGVLVGKGNKYTLSNTSRICLAEVKNEAFIFVDVKDMLSENNNLPKEFKKNYCLNRDRLGSGTNGIVRMGYVISTQVKVAVKIIKKKKKLDVVKDVFYEAELMRRLNHPNIVKIFDVFDSDKTLCLVLELVQGGDLFDYIKYAGHIEECLAKSRFMDLIEALIYLHRKNIVHRDIKPENILLTSRDIANCQFKLTDFGLSRLVADHSLMHTMCGTPLYSAPEVFNADVLGYTDAVDVWSLGCVLFVMLSATSPFASGKLDQIMKGAFRFHPLSVWSNVSSGAKELISQMLQVVPSDRISLDDACYCEWFQDGSSLKRKCSYLEEMGIKKQC